MAKFKIHAGAEVDVLSKDELRGELEHARASWLGEVARGIRWKRASMFGTSDGAGAITIGENAEAMLSPGEGFVWLVKRLSISSYDPTTQALALYQGAVSGSALIVPKLAAYTVQMDELLMPKDTLVVSGTVAATTKIWVTVQVKEAPISLLWRI